MMRGGGLLCDTLLLPRVLVLCMCIVTILSILRIVHLVWEAV